MKGVEQLVCFTTAKLAKDKGFDWDTFRFYQVDGEISGFWGYSNYNMIFSNDYSAPTQYSLQKWLREEHGLLIYLLPDTMTGKWGYSITEVGYSHTEGNRFELDQVIGSYEEALEEALQVALKEVKEK